ncbi:s-protein like protein 2 [Quercus suber]|uniref:S-protein homolog n=1 Tax=Quercus suber TaxID=58331 RepID=A0AAW0LVV8_QUESU
MEKKIISQFYCFMLVLLLAFGLCTSFTSTPNSLKRFVRIVNHLKSDTLGYQCKSIIDDLGIRTVPPNQWWEFSFHLSLIIETEFNCHFWYQNVKAYFTVFRVALGDRCGGDHCIWIAQEDGLYLYNIRSNHNVKMYNWNK